MKKINQKGFTILEIALLIVLVGALCGVIGYVISSQRDSVKKDSTASQTVSDKKDAQKTTTQQPLSQKSTKPDKEQIIDTLVADCKSSGSNDEVTTRTVITKFVSNQTTIIQGDHASVALSCDDEPGSGFRAYLKKVDAWTVVVKGQQTPNCTDLDGQGFPGSVAQCTDATGNTRDPK